MSDLSKRLDDLLEAVYGDDYSDETIRMIVDALEQKDKRIAELEAVVEAAIALHCRLAVHFQGTYDWKEQEDLDKVLAILKDAA